MFRFKGQSSPAVVFTEIDFETLDENAMRRIFVGATRASLKAVPPSIRDAALGVGASRLQTVTHHVLPLAMPGMDSGAP